MAHPVTAGFKLNSYEAELARLRLRQIPSFRERERVTPGDLVRGLCFFPNASPEDLEEILSWKMPLLVLAGREASSGEIQELHARGVAALWRFPEKDDPLLFPPLELPEKKSGMFLLSANDMLRDAARQILSFAGRDLRADFYDARALTEILKAAQTEERPGPPELVILDLDAPGADMHFFSRGMKELRGIPAEKRPEIMALKDFSRAGTDLQGLSNALGPYVRRVFHPLEAPRALLDAYLFQEIRPRKNEAGADLRERRPDLTELLRGDRPRIAPFSPEEIYRLRKESLNELRAAAPFHSYYEYLNSQASAEGLVFRSRKTTPDEIPSGAQEPFSRA